MGFTHADIGYDLVDLPGAYSLTSFSPEERVTRDFLLLERPEVAVIVADAADLERHLCLAFQVLEMGLPAVLCLNMADVARRRGIRLDAPALARALGIPVVLTVGARGAGREELGAAIAAQAGRVRPEAPVDTDWRLDYGSELEPALERLAEQLAEHRHLAADFPVRWLAVKLLEEDPDVRRLLRQHTHDLSGDVLIRVVDRTLSPLRALGTGALSVAAARQREAARLTAACVTWPESESPTHSDRVDRWALHPVGGWLILAAVLLGFYELVMVGGTALADRIFPLLELIREPLGRLFVATDPLRTGLLESLVMDGLVEGVLALLYYLPVFFLLYLLIGALEDSGYMARISFLTDRLLSRFGLHGQATLPLILGGAIAGGCAVPGILATRGMRDERARLATILVIPLLNCVAKLPIYVFIADLYFRAWKGQVLFACSLVSLGGALLIAWLLSRFVLPGEPAPFLLELPAYHWPTARGVLQRAWQRTGAFLRKVVTVVAAVQVVFWFCLAFPRLETPREQEYDSRLQVALDEFAAQAGPDNPFVERLNRPALAAFLTYRERRGENAADAPLPAQPDFSLLLAAQRGEAATPAAARAGVALDQLLQKLEAWRGERRREQAAHSLAGVLGRSLEPLTKLAGFDWRINLAILSALPAREVFVSSLGTIGSLENAAPSGDASPASAANQPARLPAAGGGRALGLALLAFAAFFPPCLPTVVAIKAETGRLRWAFFALTYPFALGFLAAVLTYQISLRLALGG